MFTQRRMNALALLLSLITPASAAGQSASAPITHASPVQLRGWLKQYPDADANRDGTLAVEEAKAYRQKLVGRQAREAGESGVRHEYTFATMSDGVRIALAVKGKVPLRMYFHQGGHGGTPPLETNQTRSRLESGRGDGQRILSHKRHMGSASRHPAVKGRHKPPRQHHNPLHRMP